MDLKFSYANLASYTLLKMGGKRYIIDTNSTVGKHFFVGLLPDEVTVTIIELSKDDTSFEVKTPPHFSTTATVIAVQPLVHYMSNGMQHFFSSNNISQQVLLKLLMFAFSMFLSYFISIFYVKSARRIAEYRLPQHSRRYKLSFKPSGKRNRGLISLVFPLVCLVFFMATNNGSEGVFLIINGILSFFLFLSLQAPAISVAYNNQELLFNGIEEG